MIKLNKLTVPPEIAEKIRQRQQHYNELDAKGEQIPDSLASAYKAPEVKELLRCETAEKCAYCESKISHVDYGDVEHLLPKSKFPQLRYSYENLTYTCSVCNTKKGDFFDAQTPLLNPYKDKPEDHLMAVGSMIFFIPGSDRGLVTQKRLALNRSNLVERRGERLESVATLIDQIARTKTSAIREVLLHELKEECEASEEYAFVVRTYVEAVLPWIN
ncbi:TIGR02646 family protein [Nitrosospira multiformis ATCC 25196]|uniref:TIGR02646 family protein n=1 Tax=Nitrosospira multiformis (strain ATCC 25196 / NCIMB 11849 / C 71) TaxID=323848 RepID=Q2YCU1_NITMU|nr:HNH endonuclease signature motif containing protein [Nitrosospira multiformis]ABB73430.1 hypothetical protein Nmul_A0121 [Nitrosospira multiformis ATCC 25196]SEG11856.1 TIGR02646 family protein [Nitrosospira multiformis ATCC 25196]